MYAIRSYYAILKTAGVLTAAAFCLAPIAAEAAAPKCEVDRPVVFAALDWDSAAFHNALAESYNFV